MEAAEEIGGYARNREAEPEENGLRGNPAPPPDSMLVFADLIKNNSLERRNHLGTTAWVIPSF
ncbi:hypothetical protein C0033_18395 [Clostridium sp. chh4-2]|nr:hypothetical protein C0033_18395 [Clostridium sp. chh4-2]